MSPWHVFNPDHQFPGQILIDLANAVGGEEIMPYFEKYGLTNIDPTAWYPQQKLLDIYNDMESSRAGTMFDFISIGMKQSQQAIVPDKFASLPLLTILQGIGEVFKLNNRGSDTGEIKCEAVADGHVKMILRVTSPDNLWYGILYGFVKRFIPKGANFTLYFDKEVPRRDEGGTVTIIHIVWG